MTSRVPTRLPIIYLCRHGQTEWNAQGRRQGQLDSPLTDLGTQQAERIASIVSAEKVDIIFASPLGRAQETARIIASRMGLPISTIDELAEVHHGRFAGMTNDEIEHQFPGELDQRNQNKYQWRFPDGESYADAELRATRVLHSIAESSVARPLIVSHEMISRMLLRDMLGATADEALSFSLPHGTVLQIDPASTLAIQALRGTQPG